MAAALLASAYGSEPVPRIARVIAPIRAGVADRARLMLLPAKLARTAVAVRARWNRHGHPTTGAEHRARPPRAGAHAVRTGAAHAQMILYRYDEEKHYGQTA